MIFKAILFAAEAHKGQYRKGTNIPYMSHLMNVMKTLCQNNCNEHTIVAGILHDAVEDTATTLEDIENEFGKRVTEIVAVETQKMKLNKYSIASKETWEQRKSEKLEVIKNLKDVDCLWVYAADKLDNISAIYEDYQAIGDELWNRFNAPKEKQEWYYREICKIMKQKAIEFPQLCKIVSKIEDLVLKTFGK